MSDTARILRDPCGCRSTDTRWVSLCNAHEAEWREIHERWGRDHRAKQAAVTPVAAFVPGAPAAPGLFD